LAAIFCFHYEPRKVLKQNSQSLFSYSDGTSAEDQPDDKKYKEEKEQNSCNIRRRTSNTTKTKDSGDNSYNQKNNGPI
jgi:hypothetical protein